MSFLEELSNGVSDIAKDVGGAAKDLSQSARVQANIKAEQLRIQNLYYKLGKSYFEQYESTPDTGVQELVEEITKANERIAEYKNEQ